MVSHASAMASSVCLTMSLPILPPNSSLGRLNSSFGGARVIADNTVSVFNSRGGESLPCLRIRAEGAPNLETGDKVSGWRGVPTKLNTCPHSREIRQYFYKDACQAAKNAIDDGKHKLKVLLTIPELNPEMDVYRIGTLLELIRELAFTFANDGKRVRVCVQGPMGEGIFSGMPLALSGTRPMLERMDWGEYIEKDTFIRFGAVGAKEVYDDDDMFILMAPQNAVGNCIIDDLKAMVEAAGDRPVIILNPKLKDIPASGGIMQVGGRQERMEFAESFFTCYNFRLMMAYPGPYEIYRRFDLDRGVEVYKLIASFDHEPTRSEISDAYNGIVRTAQSAPTGIWSFFSNLLG
ncbi:probable adenylate kinase 5, chloroplastic isoform X2 [Physcomitrium patens]|uniref:DUF1995 domain-containing protein n=1 Tax=Physcomitrium patens TaxID=3218 RepID=A0A7I4CHZ5_PHYPA|nr:probable adenylate kinase 5, chloroplastic isoform X2 [Physcomitrium patens]|eukprot:XP_024362202.1 probable adenylate kinase 5, chloroplastic isoform X2 [Physcomitrella patens]